MASSRDPNIKDRLKSHKREQHSKLVYSRHLAYFHGIRKTDRTQITVLRHNDIVLY